MNKVGILASSLFVVVVCAAQDCVTDVSRESSAAIALLQRNLELAPHDFDIHYQLAKAYKENERFSEAIAHYRCAVALQPSNSKAIVELATTLTMFEDTVDECIALYYRALDLDPCMTSALYNLAYTLKKQGSLQEALELYDIIIEDTPDYALAHFSRALTYLMLGDWQRGWPEYEWRWKSYGKRPKSFSKKLWDGGDVDGKRILIYAEQGLGDSLQFGRYLKVLKERGAYVIFVAQPALKDLFLQCVYIDKVCVDGDPYPPFDVYAPLMSLPLLCNTRLDSVPCSIAYIQADPVLVAYWANQLLHDTNFKVGLCWQGNANYQTAFLRQAVAAKSVNVNTFAPLARVPGVSFYSLQKVFGQEQLNDLSSGFVVKSFDQDFDESHGRFMDTAAVMKNFDLIISVDTSICHLAGALGVEVWVPLPHPADWRWMLQRADTPWYPTMRLFRQEKAGQWGPVIEQITKELFLRVANHSKKST